MCLTFPGRVVALDDAGATVETEGRTRRASTLFHPDVEVGEWVVVAAGTIVERLDDETADLMRESLLEAIRLDDADADRERGAKNGVDR